MSASARIDGRELRTGLRLGAEVVVVGSGPAGATVAAELAAAGVAVVVVEAGRWWEPHEFRPGTFGAMADAFRDMGASMVVGGAPVPYVQGRMVGGSSPVNGAICWRLPRDVHRSWLADDGALSDALPWDVLEAVTDQIENRLGVAPTDDAVAGAKNRLMARGAEALGIEHRPIRRNVVGCRGLGRCLQGCPEGHKASVDRTLLADAEAAGAVVVSSVEVSSVITSRGRAVGVQGTADGGGAVRVMASHAVVVAASAVQTPALLLASGFAQGPVGEHFQAHPGVSMTGRFAEPVRMWEGASQGHEVTGLRHEGLKFEVLGMGVDLLAARVGGVGSDLAHHIEDLAHHADWGAAVRAEAHGRVRLVAGRPVVTYQPTARDVGRYRRGLRIMGEMMLAAGAETVDPGVRGFDRDVRDPRRLRDLEDHGPRSAAAFTAAITHMFGSARMGSDPARSVVGLDFQHHNVAGLYVADSSVFPSNLGVNPQIPIMAIAVLCARRVAGLDLDRPATDPVLSSSHTHGVSNMTIPGPIAARLELEDLMSMSGAQLWGLMQTGGRVDPDALAGQQFLGADLSMGRIGHAVLWETFRKAIVRDEEGRGHRGWNVKLEQRGTRGDQVPKRKRDGSEAAFAHYRVRTDGERFGWPRGFRVATYFDYGTAGNVFPDGFGFTPVVTVNGDDHDLVLGWEIFRVAGRFVAPSMFWAIRPDGPVDPVVTPPRAPRP